VRLFAVAHSVAVAVAVAVVVDPCWGFVASASRAHTEHPFATTLTRSYYWYVDKVQSGPKRQWLFKICVVNQYNLLNAH